jgi:hypothetical protein
MLSQQVFDRDRAERIRAALDELVTFIDSRPTPENRRSLVCGAPRRATAKQPACDEGHDVLDVELNQSQGDTGRSAIRSACRSGRGVGLVTPTPYGASSPYRRALQGGTACFM